MKTLPARSSIGTFFLAVLAWSLPAVVRAQPWMDTSLSPEQRADLLLAAMSLDDKVAMVQGGGGPYVGNILANPTLGIPALALQDGPAGVAGGAASVTALPPPIALAASWDTTLARQYGTVLAEEERGKGVHVVLAPMMNLVRVAQSGRNFEGYGEDPFLAATIAAAEIRGIQSLGVIATAKHFVCNDQETDRKRGSSDVDERTRQEVYYPPFRASVRAGLGAVMASYNRVNTRSACESEALNSTLKKLWGFDGFVMSDWWADFTTVAGADNGLDLEMPGETRFGTSLRDAVQNGTVPASELDGMVRRILAGMFRFGVFDNPPTGDLWTDVTSPAHVQFARDAAAAGMVLLKNNPAVLPLDISAIHSIAVVGSVASTAPISTGGGSASVNLPYEISPLTGITDRAGAGVTVLYSVGDGGHIPEAVQLAQRSDIAIVCVGQRTSEDSDRATIALPGDQSTLVSSVAAANPRTVVVLYASAATLLPSVDQLAAVLVAWYPGQENGHALASVLFGDVTPGGKLPVTFPYSVSQVPAGTPAQFPGIKGHVSYSEQLLVGYRWYDALNATPLFPFGHGLSYTTFVYSNLTVSGVSASGQVKVGLDVANLGPRPGAEVVQLYLGFPGASGEPPKQLKAFKKVLLDPGQVQRVTLPLSWEDLATWDTGLRGWTIPQGTFQVMVGSSSRDIRLSSSFVTPSDLPASDLVNAALHQPATTSTAVSSSLSGSAAVDGDPATCWTPVNTDPQWLYVDLGAVKNINRVRLQWNTNYARRYALQVSTNTTVWSSIFATTAGAGEAEDILTSGTGRYLRLNMTQSASPSGSSLAELEVYSPPQRPLGGTPLSLPGRIQAEQYDTGGEGVAYHDSTPENSGNGYRSDNVDLEPAIDSGGGYDVGWIADGEWLEYSVSVPDSVAIYRVGARVASPLGGQLRIRLDGTVLGTASIPNTGAWQNWQTVTFPDVTVLGGPGTHALRFEMLGGGFNLNWVDLDRVEICATNNVVLDRPASASSLESGSYPASSGFDGDLRTRWSSAFSDPQWLKVDLGAVRNLSRVRLIWETAFAQAYSLQVSLDNSTWTDMYSTAAGPGGINDLAVSSTGRYLRVYATQRATGWGDSLFECEAYPPEVPSLTIGVVGSDVYLRWPASLFAWTLESTSELSPIATWTTVSTAPVLVNSENIVSIPLAAGARFFRLRQTP